jgi:hypothetical protein
MRHRLAFIALATPTLLAACKGETSPATGPVRPTPSQASAQLSSGGVPPWESQKLQVEIVSVSQEFGPDNVGVLRAECPAGKSVLGGGHVLEGTSNPLPSPTIDRSFPATASSWEVAWHYHVNITGVRLTVYAVCAA